MKALEGKNPHMCACVGWCVRLEVLSPLVSDCFPTICVCVGWCVRLPKSPFVVFHCLPSPFLFPFLEWCARLFEVLSPLVTHCFPVSPIVSPPVCTAPCVGWCVRLLEVLAPIVSHGLLKWCVRLPDVLFPICLPLSPHVCPCWMVCPPSRGLVSPCLPSCLFYSCLRLSPRVSHCPIVSKCFPWSTFPKSCFSLSPIVSPDMCACVGWCLRLGSYPPSRRLVSHCLPTRVPVLDVVPAFPRSCLRLSPIVSPHVCLCWMVRPPSRGLVSHCLPSCFPVLDGVSAFRGFVSLVSQLASQLVFLLVSQLVSQLVFLLVSLCGGWSDFAFFQTVYCWGRLS